MPVNYKSEQREGKGGGRERDMPLIKLIYAKYNSNKQCSHVHAAAQRAKLALPQKSQTAADDCQNKWHVYHTPSGPQCVEQFGSCIYILHIYTHQHTYICIWAMM